MSNYFLTTILLPAPHAHDYYSFFYLLGFAVAGALLLWEGHRRKYPLRPWLLLVAGSSLLLILGTKLITLSAADWLQLLHAAPVAEVGQRSVLGGILGAVLGLAVLRRWLGFGRGVYDAFALPFIIGLAVQGLGCLLTGCCFGTITPGSLPWAVAYAPDTLAFLAQVAQGQLPATAAHSLAVHPAQLYQLLLCLGIGVGLVRTRRQSWPAGTRLVLMLGLYAAGRFGLEFWRAPFGDVVGAGDWYGFKPVQLVLLPVALALLGCFSRIVRIPSRSPLPETVPANQPARTLAGAAALLALTALLGPAWLVLPELLMVKALLLPVVMLEAGFLLLSSQAAKGQVALRATLAAVCLLLTSQAPAPPDSVVSTASRSYTSFSVGGAAGRSEQYYESPYYGCSGPTQYPISTYEQKYVVGSVGVARTVPVGKSATLTLGLNASLGRTRFRPMQDTIKLINSSSYFEPIPLGNSARLYAYSPYIELASPKYMRFGIGAHIGHVAYDHMYKPGLVTKVAPQFLFEIGKFNVLYFHLSANHGLLGFGDGTVTVGAGSGLGKDNFRLLSGVAFVNSKSKGGDAAHFEPGLTLGFVRANLLLSQRWQLEPFIATNFNDVSKFVLQTSYRLPSKAR